MAREESTRQQRTEYGKVYKWGVSKRIKSKVKVQGVYKRSKTKACKRETYKEREGRHATDQRRGKGSKERNERTMVITRAQEGYDLSFERLGLESSSGKR
jgi:hypothetical protein